MLNRGFRRYFVKTRIKEFRARHDLTQEALAKLVGVRRETIVFLEKGKYNPSLKLAYRIARSLGSTIDELFIFEDSDLE
jgi:DNA-binding XRE family transcriptional regulator